MMDQKNRITPGQLMFMIINAQLGYSILALPFSMFSVAKTDGWISTLVAGLITQVMILIIWAIGKKFPSATIFEILPTVFGKTLGTILHTAYIVYFILVGSLILVRLGMIIEKWVLPKTPDWALFILMTVVCVYLVKEPLRTIARFLVFTTALVPLMIVIAAYSFTHANLLYILPIGQAGWINIVKGTFDATMAMQGFELLLVVYPYVEGDSKTILKAASLGNAMVTLLYAFIVFTSLVFFSPKEMELVPEPVLYMLRAFTFSLIDRPDLYFLTIWMAKVATTLMINLYLASSGMTRLFGGKRHHQAVYVAAALFFLIALFPRDPFMLEAFTQFTSKITYLFTFVIPLLILGIISVFSIRKKGESKS